MKNLKKKFIKLDSHHRLHGLSKPIIGLTGGIATGKSSAAQILKNKGYAVIDADQIVKKIYRLPETFLFIKDLCPQVIESETINFQELRKIFFSEAHIKDKIETFIYKKIPSYFLLETEKFKESSFLFYDVPLLFEKKMAQYFDLVILIYAPESTQLERVTSRDQCSSEVAKKILVNQIDIEEKKKISDFVILNTGSINDLEQKISLCLNQILEKA